MARGVNDNGIPIVDVSGSTLVAGGNVASGAADTGNPQKVGGRYNTTPPTLTDGQRGDLQMGTRASAKVQLMVADSATAVGPLSGDGSGAAGALGTTPGGFNGASWDRQRNNFEATLLASAARTASTNSPDQVNYNGDAVMLVLNVTAQPGGGETLSLKLQAKDPVSGTYVDLYDAGVLFTAATGAKGMVVSRGLTAADLAAAWVGKAGPVPRTWRAVVTHSAAGAWTYSLAGNTWE